ncbi:MAG: glutaredoxin family protein [Woeseiaceae bacterium]|nr:glutaredoxin family protein [Woeseiaceae bacterium]
MPASKRASRPSRQLYVYSRSGCHLCEMLIERLLPMIRDRLQLEVRDIDSRAEWKLKYGVNIPVVEYQGEILCQHHLDDAAIRAVLDGLADS